MGKLIDTAVIGKKGGEARAKALTPEELSEQGRYAVNERWRKHREKQAGEQRPKKTTVKKVGKKKAAK